MKKYSVFIIMSLMVIGIFIIGTIFWFPVYFMWLDDRMVHISMFRISYLKSTILVVLLLCKLILILFKLYKPALLINIITIVFFAFLCKYTYELCGAFPTKTLSRNYMFYVIFGIYLINNLIRFLKKVLIDKYCGKKGYSYIWLAFVVLFIVVSVYLTIKEYRVVKNEIDDKESWDGIFYLADLTPVKSDEKMVNAHAFAYDETINITYEFVEKPDYEYSIEVQKVTGIQVVELEKNNNGFSINFLMKQEGAGKVELVYVPEEEHVEESIIVLATYSENGVTFVDDYSDRAAESRYYDWMFKNYKIDLAEMKAL